MLEHISIEKPEWLTGGLESMQKFLTLESQGRIPPSIKGWMIVTHCMRILRAVYGSDLETVCALRKRILDDENYWLEQDAKVK